MLKNERAENTIIMTDKLTKFYNQKKSNEVRAVDNINLVIETNQVIVLRGPSGSGKTTLLGMLACLSKPTAGKYLCLGEQVSRWSEKFLTLFRQQHLGIIFQNFNLVPGLSAFYNIALPLMAQNIRLTHITSRVMELARSLRITHRLDYKVDLLSGGEMQRVAIARALINEPKILIADEPTAHLDSELAAHILDTFGGLKEQGKTLIIATHDSLVIEHPMVDNVLCIRDGQLRQADDC